MRVFKYINCIDANSRYCPCELSEIGECLVCSQLNGGQFCECTNYSGLCIYQEFVWNNEKACMPRRYKEYPIMKREFLRKDVLLFHICVDRRLAEDLTAPGAFVFLKKPGAPDSFGTPISILDSDKEKSEIVVAMKIAGVKTKHLAECNDSFMVKGPFWNGIQGRIFLNGAAEESILIVGRGIGLAPAVLAAKILRSSNRKVFSLLEKGRGEKNYLESYFSELGCEAKSMKLMCEGNRMSSHAIEQALSVINDNKVRTVLSAGNDVFHKSVINELYKYNKELRFATVNNATMCCGEGNCGSCIQSFGNRKKIKACKLQFNPLEYFLERQEAE